MATTAHSMKRSRTSRLSRLGDSMSWRQAVPHTLLLLFTLATLAPYAWTLAQSFQPLTDNVAWTTHNYNQVVDYGPFAASYMNSVVVAITVTASAVLTSVMVGFVLSKYRFRGKEQLFTLLIAALMVPFSVILVPVYITVVHLGLDDSTGGLIVAALWSPFGIFTVRQFMEGIPSELLDAARIDGASEWRIVAQLMIPLCTSALTVLAVYTFVQSWDSFLLPVLLLRHSANWTLPILLSSGLGAATPTVAAVVVLTTLPALVIIAVTSKFIRGIALASIHG